ncbi:N-6 DNA methylase [Thermococcus henrietii]|uniref:N-6 DNA methylase n=1 Tax=Thermococcus henrietii TaxID=2016361 RepID=UPI000C06F00C|nr:N-6 DNA methylase [Thermococcus henrietii]
MVVRGSTLDKLIKKVDSLASKKGIKKEKTVMIKEIKTLVNEYGYDPTQIEAFVPVQMGSSIKEADIVVYKSTSKKVPLIVIETKSPDKKKGLKQAISYAVSLGAKYAKWTNGDDFEVVYIQYTKDTHVEEPISDIPLAHKYGKKLKYGNGIGMPLVPIRDSDEFKKLMKHVHDIIRNVEKKALHEAFKVASRLIYAKVYDEKTTGREEYYSFQAGYAESITDVADRIRKLYSRARKREPSIFPEDLEVSNDLTLFKIAKLLGKYSLRDTDLDIKGEAYQHFLDSNMRGDLGQYFTPREITKAMVEIADPGEDHKILDPACGTGGFLLYSLFYVREKMIKKYGLNSIALRERLFEVAHYQIYGIEVSPEVAQAAISSMILSDDSHSNIKIANALAPWKELKSYGLEKEMFDIILTNPPLGLYEEDRKILDQFETGKGLPRQLSQVLFVERGLEFLKPGGLMVTIMSEDALENNERFIEFLNNNAYVRGIISLPRDAFKPYGANSKTNILIIQKPSPEIPETKKVFMAEAEFVGFDTSGKRISKNDLPIIVQEWRKFVKDIGFWGDSK